MKTKTELLADIDRVTAERDAERLRADVAVADANDAESAGKKVSQMLATRTAERDAALESITRLNDKISCMSAHVLAYKLSRQRLLGRARVRELLISELQQRLTAADERADLLEGLLRRIKSADAIYPGSPLMVAIDAALQPAEVAQ